jgi:hypothetical protein
MRSFLIGFYSGLVISALRAPLGLELLQVPGTTASAAMAYRAAALLVVAIGLILGIGRTRSTFSPTWLLVGTAAGYEAHWQLVSTPSPILVQLVFSLLLVVLLVAGHRGGPDTRPNKLRIIALASAALGGWFLLSGGFPQSHAAAIGCGLVGTYCIAIVGRFTAVEQAEEAPGDRPPTGGLSAIAICGAGLAILAEGLARHLRLLGAGTLEDDSIYGTVFLGLGAFGAISFGRLFQKRRSTVMARGCAAALSGLSAWAAFRVLTNLASPRGLDLYVRQFEAVGFDWDLSIHGLWKYDMVVAAPILVICTFLCGTVIALHRRPIELAALLIGAGAGLVLSPGLLEYEWSAEADKLPMLLSSSNSASMALFGGLVAAGGALLVFLTATDLGKAPRLLGCIVAFGGIALCRFPQQEAIEILSPWEQRAPQPVWTLDTPEGFLTVELAGRDEAFATLNRNAITPRPDDVRADLFMIAQSFEMLGERSEDQEGPKVLFVGQLDPNRALLMSDLGAARIDRTASWHKSMAALEHRLFGSKPRWFAGEILDLAEARAALDRGEYDLVVVPAIEGDAPTTRNLASPEATTVVVWLDAAGGIEDQFLGEHVLTTVDRLEKMYLGLARGPQVEDLRLAAGHRGPAFLKAGDPRPGMPAIELLSMHKPQRRDARQALVARRLAEAERSPGIAEGLAIHFGAQVRSSPFESSELQVELDPDAAKRFSEAASGEAPSLLEIEVIETLAYLLTAQRKVEEIDRFITRPASKHEPWAALEVALGQASLEFLEPEAAVENLQRAHRAWAGTALSWAMQAEAEQQAGEDKAAAISLERALGMEPGNHEIERRLAIAWKRAGDPRGEQALREALAHHPEDPQLLAHEGSGPYPAPPAGYHAVVGGDHDH